MHFPHGKDRDAFRAEFERALGAAGAGIADFTRFVFPEANYAGREFKPQCVFFETQFLSSADFANVAFARAADFQYAKFAQRAYFNGATFSQEVSFNSVTFSAKVLFDTATCAQRADFRGGTFTQGAQFRETTFSGETEFAWAKFIEDTDFYKARFMHETHFDWATFSQGGDFRSGLFKERANFRRATFTQGAGFWETEFEKGVDFVGTVFTQRAHFNSTKFGELVDFARAQFLGAAEFASTRFRADGKLIPGPAFSSTEFSKPELVLFQKTHLSQALFHNCDISKVTFSSVDWRQRAGRGKRMVFEEEVDLSEATAIALKPKNDDPNERDYSLIAETYQQLKKNYDERKDYWTANDFHYGEMEMKRLHSRRRNFLARWLHRHLGLIAMYKCASEYGNSYVRPAILLLLVFATFTLLFPWAGLDRSQGANQSIFVSAGQSADISTPQSELRYRHFSDYVNAFQGRKWLGVAAFFGNSLMTTLSVAGFQKELRYEPSYPWGRALALLELLLTSTLVALFLLALRRQFRR